MTFSTVSYSNTFFEENIGKPISWAYTILYGEVDYEQCFHS